MSSIEKKPNGRYLARWRDPSGRQKARTFDRKADADRFVSSVTVDIAQGSYVDPNAGRMTLGEWWATWSANQVQWSPGSRERYEGAWRNHLEPRLSSHPLGRIGHGELQALLADCGLGPSGTSLLRTMLSAMFRAAVRERLVAVSPADGLKVPRLAPDEPRPLDEAEIDALVAACDANERAWVLTGLGTGVRISESLAIRTGTLNFLRRELTVADQARTPKAGPVVLAPVKNRKPRTIPLAQSLVDVLAQQVERTVREVGGRRDGLLFPAAGGGLQRRGQASARFVAIVERAGLDPGITWHNLRDTAATSMLRAGLNPAYVAKVLGNTVPVLLTRYAGVLPDDADRARAVLDVVTARAAGTG